MTDHATIGVDHPFIQKIAALAVEADELGFRNTSLALGLIVQCAGMRSSVVTRLVNTAAMLVEAVKYAVNGNSRKEPPV